MEQSQPTPSDSQPIETTPPPPQQPQSSSVPSSSLLPPNSSAPPTSTPSLSSSPNPNPTPSAAKTSVTQSQPQTQLQQQSSVQNSQTRPPFSRPWQQPSPFSHFSTPLASSMATSHSSSSSPLPAPASSSVSGSSSQRGGMAIGVPALHPSPSSQPNSFPSLSSPSFGPQFGGLGRSITNVPDSVPSSSTSQVRQPIQGMPGMGVMGSLGSSSQMRPVGVPAHHQLRPAQSSLRPQGSSSNQSPASPNFQGQGMLRVPAVISPGSPSPNTSQGSQSHNQPWLSSGSQGKPPLPPPSLRPQISPQTLQQRSHIPQQQQQTASAQQQQQPSSSHQPQDHVAQQFSQRAQQPLPHQPQITRSQGLGSQKPLSHPGLQPSAVQPGPSNKLSNAENGESCVRILSKRSIQELVNQIDPSEQLDPEVEDILVDIADEFIESITTFGCSLAKHRKSSTLEGKDILLHLERNWNMTLPGFSGDEIKSFRKMSTNDIHRERLAAIKKSAMVAETANSRSTGGQTGGNAKGHVVKAPANVLGSPNPQIREAA